MKNKILSVRNLEVKFRVRSRVLTAIRNVSFDLYDGEILALVGESGSGKSVITKTFTGMIESNGWISDGSIIYKPNQKSKDDDLTFFKKSVNIVEIENSIVEKSVIKFITKTNLNKIKKLNKEIKEILKLNPLEKSNDVINQNLDKIELKISNVVEKNEIAKSKSIEFTKRKDAQKLSQLEKELKDLKFKKRIILEDDLRNDEIKKLEKEILEINIETKKVKALSMTELAVIKKIIPAIESNIQNQNAFTPEFIEEINTNFAQKIYTLKFEKELKAIFDQIAKDKKINGENEEHFSNLMEDWRIVSAPIFKRKNVGNKALREVRGKTIATIFQDPMTSLNPLLTVGFQLSEILRRQLKLSKEETKKEAIKLLDQVGIPNPEQRYKDIPGKYSGGMRQRVVIAIALACRPKILICDEPTTALDVTIQAQILKLIKSLQKEYNFSVIFITHDLGVVANIADRVAVMYAGQIIEIGTTEEIFEDAKHPYTWALLLSLPQLGVKGEKLYSIPGTPPNLFNEIKGDAFAPRNKYALKIDYMYEPPMFKVSDTHYAKTWLLHEYADKNIKPKKGDN
ncbi:MULTISPECIES: oligopeptide ABC transporter ATP-binding protein OppD [Mesoplasma]|uniref:ABC transporter ATP-binding protein n=1 Tax=Mesoplasma florum TaxID=2151 RepID=A0A2R3P6Y8_MESFO|nr:MULTISPECIES: oligopeptide ABC transporter ATP-binding protein OppD [Mesoplasma]AVN64234.1 ABC transporter ATP-binding protein [Mesoplasma florum]